LLLATEPCSSFSLGRSRRSITRWPLAILDPQRLPAAHPFSFLVLAAAFFICILNMDPAPSPAAHHMFPYLVSRTDITRFKRVYSIRLRTAAHLFPVAVLVWIMAMWCADVNKPLSPAVRKLWCQALLLVCQWTLVGWSNYLSSTGGVRSCFKK
jgi:hypothetical protein